MSLAQHAGQNPIGLLSKQRASLMFPHHAKNLPSGGGKRNLEMLENGAFNVILNGRQINRRMGLALTTVDDIAGVDYANAARREHPDW